jgi:hypothetical protein
MSKQSDLRIAALEYQEKYVEVKCLKRDLEKAKTELLVLKSNLIMQMPKRDMPFFLNLGHCIVGIYGYFVNEKDREGKNKHDFDFIEIAVHSDIVDVLG